MSEWVFPLDVAVGVIPRAAIEAHGFKWDPAWDGDEALGVCIVDAEGDPLADLVAELRSCCRDSDEACDECQAEVQRMVVEVLSQRGDVPIFGRAVFRAPRRQGAWAEVAPA